MQKCSKYICDRCGKNVNIYHAQKNVSGYSIYTYICENCKIEFVLGNIQPIGINSFFVKFTNVSAQYSNYNSKITIRRMAMGRCILREMDYFEGFLLDGNIVPVKKVFSKLKVFELFQ